MAVGALSCLDRTAALHLVEKLQLDERKFQRCFPVACEEKYLVRAPMRG